MGAAPLIFSADSVAASGTLVNVLSVDVQGNGPCRLTIKNVGVSNALTAAQVKVGQDTSHMAVLESTTFASLAASGGIAQLWIERPVNILEVYVTCASGTTLDLRLSRHTEL